MTAEKARAARGVRHATGTGRRVSQQVDAPVTASKFTAHSFTGGEITADPWLRMTADLSAARSADEQELKGPRPRATLTALVDDGGVRVASGGSQHDPGPQAVSGRGLHPGCPPDRGPAIG